MLCLLRQAVRAELPLVRFLQIFFQSLYMFLIVFLFSCHTTSVRISYRYLYLSTRNYLLRHGKPSDLRLMCQSGNVVYQGFKLGRKSKNLKWPKRVFSQTLIEANDFHFSQERFTYWKYEDAPNRLFPLDLVRPQILFFPQVVLRN